MPYLNCKLNIEESEEIANDISEVLLKNTSEILGKKAEVTAINIEFVGNGFWYIGKQKAKDSFFLDIKITEGTNTKEQKQSYIKQVFEDMKNILGELEPASYIVIDDVRSDSWGFDGMTQEMRFLKKEGI